MYEGSVWRISTWILCLEGLIQFQKDEEIYRYYQIPLD